MNVIDLDVERTIIAIASPPCAAPRGIIRLSGPDSVSVVDGICISTGSALPFAHWKKVQLSVDGLSCLVPAKLLIWPIEQSYTRQPSAEIHVVGCPPILDAIVQSLCKRGAELAR